MLIYVICVCLRIVVSNTYFVVLFLFCLSSSRVPNVASFSRLFILDFPFGFLLRLLTCSRHGVLFVCILIQTTNLCHRMYIT
jgi:hypothetical protein